MSENFNLEIISPDKKIFSGQATEVIIPCYEGIATILKDHIPLITFLRPGIIEIKASNEKFYIEEGTVEFVNNNLLILTTLAENLKSLSNEKRNEMIKEAESLISKNELSDKQRFMLDHKIETLRNFN